MLLASAKHRTNLLCYRIEKALLDVPVFTYGINRTLHSNPVNHLMYNKAMFIVLNISGAPRVTTLSVHVL